MSWVDLDILGQLEFQMRLSRKLGWRNGLHYRLLMVRERFRICPRGLMTISSSNLMFPIVLRVGSSDADVYEQVLRNQEYGAFNDIDAEFIVDCGANAGYTSAYFLSRFPKAKVIAIEPFAPNAQLCRRNLAPYGSRAEVIEAAVWSHSTRVSVTGVRGQEWGAQVHPAPAGAEETIPSIDLGRLGLPWIDILKVDIEGSEKELFSAPGSWLPNVRNIVIELHGPDCERQFMDAMRSYKYDLLHSGELTICKGISPLAVA